MRMRQHKRGWRQCLFGWLTAAALLVAPAGCSRTDGPAVSLPAGSAASAASSASAASTWPSTSAATVTEATNATDTTSVPEESATTGTHSATPQGSATTTRATAATGTTTASSAATTRVTTPPRPALEGELRGVWVSYIELNKLLGKKTADEAKTVLDDLLDSCASYGINALFFHVRANSDAYYASSIFKPAASVASLIESGFDPLAYAVEGAHKRGMQLHAWINPYRIGTDESYAVGDKGDRFCKYRNTKYEQKTWYYIPTSTAAQKTILDGIREILDRYAVDGIHFDDYFYPENDDPKVGIHHEQPESFESDFNPSGSLSLGDWRRAAVDALIIQAYAITHQKPGAVFGVSPQAGAEHTRDKLYADTVKWLGTAGYVDYLCPQVYFGFEHRSSAFDKVTERWLGYKRAAGVQLYIGMGLYKTGIDDDTWAGDSGRREWIENDDIMKRQVEYLRTQPQVGGMVFYSYTYFDPVACGELQGEGLEVAKREVQNLLPLLRG